MTSNRFCVFCGNPPEKKNREHILPQWLLDLTGDPKRVVNFGTNYKNGRTVRFDWLNFCVPACESCNAEFSNLEGRAKSYVLRLTAREALSSIEYSDFLDWLDKVRIGVWVAYHFIQGNPTNIEPSFHIKTRICQKDRMVAIYPIAGDGVGLNAFGVESLIYHSQPSCFALRINDLLIFNMSTDYLFSARCGFPFPKSRYIALDGDNPYLMHMSDFQITRRVKHPLVRWKIAKPSIHLYQPIMNGSSDERFQSGFLGDYNSFDSYLARHTMPPYPSGKGILYFQHQDRVEPIIDINQPIEFESINGCESRPMHELVKQVYKFQIYLFEIGEFTAKNRELLISQLRRKKALIKWNKNVISYYSALGNL
ncbi:hypothetical protein [Pseudomonas sp.]|uniref:hypothetical protein n=1 Tax=Pseudomonas sp. TaxID=306 RepID=UPI0019EB7A75|nr:hypothetical protein [Pseudomonas sp.]MBF0674657.1 hypothetical protein [Pseudomonas sp.]